MKKYLLNWFRKLMTTWLAVKAIKDFGMGTTKASIHVADYFTKFELLDNEGTYNNEVKTLLEEACNIAEKILFSEKQLLLQLADYLSDERIIKRQQIESIARKYGSLDLRNTRFAEDGNNLFYRNELKRQVRKMATNSNNIQEISEMIISLNKKS